MGIISNYKFTNKKHPEIGIMSVILGTISLVSQILVILMCYLKRMEAKSNNGMTVLLALIMAIVGLVLGIISKKKRDTYGLFPLVGIVLNSVSVLATVLIVIAGTNGV